MEKRKIRGGIVVLGAKVIEEFLKKLLHIVPRCEEFYLAASELGESKFCSYAPILKHYLKVNLGIEIVSEDMLRGLDIHEELYSGVPITLGDIVEQLLLFGEVELVEVFMAKRWNGIKFVGRIDSLVIKISPSDFFIIEIREGKSTLNPRYLYAKSVRELPLSWKIQALVYKLLTKTENFNNVRRSVFLEVIDGKTGEVTREFRVKNIDKLIPYLDESIVKLRNPEKYVLANKHRKELRYLCEFCSLKNYCFTLNNREVIDFWVDSRVKCMV